MLEVQVQLGDASAASQLGAVEDSISGDENLPEMVRLNAAVRALQRVAMEEKDQASLAATFTQGAIELVEKFPEVSDANRLLVQALDLNYEAGNEAMQQTLLSHLEGYSDGRIAADAADLEGYRFNVEAANVAARYADFDNAERILAKIKVESTPDQIVQVCSQVEDQIRKEKAKRDLVGKSLDLKFTALDGREVDVAALKGKVLLIDFWATWCGPCIAELPKVLAVYEKYHDQGFEILGISFDQEKEALEQFVEKQKMTWPHYFDGKGWNNDIGQQYGISSIPTMWLVNQQGVLVDLSARQNLDEKVGRLLAE